MCIENKTSCIAIEKCSNYIKHTHYAYLYVLSKNFQNNEAKINHKCKSIQEDNQSFFF